MTDKLETTNPPVFVQGLYEPTQDELTVETLEVTGSIPPELRGRYLRNGHNPRTGNTSGFWFNGNGMLHGIRLKTGARNGTATASCARPRWAAHPSSAPTACSARSWRPIGHGSNRH